jgi:nitrite reductase/ring-hydroxylating ferredoxin subunit
VQQSTVVPKRESRSQCVARLSELRGAGPFATTADDLDLVIVKTATGLKAFEGRCPHQGALLGEGQLDRGELVCRNHGWRFEPETGQRNGGPECLLSCPLEVRGDELWADVAGLQRAIRERSGSARRTLADLPGPRSLPLVGNLMQLEKSQMHANLEAWAAQYGSTYTIRMGPNPTLVTSEPRLTEQVLRERPEGYRRASNVAPIFHELGIDGVFSAEGAVWRPQRKLAMQALSHRQLSSFYPTLVAITKRLEQRWRLKARAGSDIDLVEELKRFTVDVTTLLVFGYDANTIAQEDEVLQRKLELVFPTLNRRLFAVMPTWRWLRMPADRNVDRALSELRAWLDQLIRPAGRRSRARRAAGKFPRVHADGPRCRRSAGLR